MTLTELRIRLQAYLEAETAILQGNQSYSRPDGVAYTRADLRNVQSEIHRLRIEIQSLTPGAYGGQQMVFGGRR